MCVYAYMHACLSMYYDACVCVYMHVHACSHGHVCLFMCACALRALAFQTPYPSPRNRSPAYITFLVTSMHFKNVIYNVTSFQHSDTHSSPKLFQIKTETTGLLYTLYIYG